MEQKSYEVGFLLSPLLPEEQATAVVERVIRAGITAADGTILAEESPKMVPLAYRIKKVVENKSSNFGEAYFGSVRFKLAPEALVMFKTAVEKAPEVIRSLIITLPAEAVNPPPKRARRTPAPAEAPVAPVEAPALVIDREIDQLLSA